jgi:DNA-binding NtrC family response regulator
MALSYERSAMSAIYSYPPPIAGTPRHPESPLVLVVDDDADEGEAKAADLRRAGLRVRTALTADNAVDCCRTQPFDAVVIDHHADDEYSETVLEEAPDVGPAVIVSTAPIPDVADLGTRHVDKVFAVKMEPVEPTELVEVVQEAVAASNMPRSP